MLPLLESAPWKLMEVHGELTQELFPVIKEMGTEKDLVPRSPGWALLGMASWSKIATSLPSVHSPTSHSGYTSQHPRPSEHFHSTPAAKSGLCSRLHFHIPGQPFKCPPYVPSMALWGALVTLRM